MNIYIWLILFLILVFLLSAAAYRKKKIKKMEKLTLTLTEDQKFHTGLKEGTDISDISVKIIEGLGGRDNIENVSAEGKRLKAIIKDYQKVSEEDLKKIHMGSILRPGKTSVHMIVGNSAGKLSEEINRKWKENMR